MSRIAARFEGWLAQGVPSVGGFATGFALGIKP
jgi:hypothetical protein